MIAAQTDPQPTPTDPIPTPARPNSLRHSTHPLAPFPGEPIKWSSYVYDDGTT